jgi:hypothetical protein
VVRHAGFEVFTRVVIKNYIFWNIRPCIPLKFNRNFGFAFIFRVEDTSMKQTLSRALHNHSCEILKYYIEY